MASDVIIEQRESYFRDAIYNFKADGAEQMEWNDVFEKKREGDVTLADFNEVFSDNKNQKFASSSLFTSNEDVKDDIDELMSDQSSPQSTTTKVDIHFKAYRVFIFYFDFILKKSAKRIRYIRGSSQFIF